MDKTKRYLIFLVGLIARLGAIAIPVIVFSRFRADMGEPLDQWPTLLWLSVGGSLILLLAFDYAKDWAKSSRDKKKHNPLHAACRQNTATISSLLEAGKFDTANHDRLIEAALRDIEHMIEIVLSKSKADSWEISANCMTYSTQRAVGGRLQLKYWGTRLAGREPIELTVNSDQPGAIQSVKKGTITYVHDTQAPDNAEFFKGKTYRSIVSIPIRNGGKLFCIVNIDATEPKIFKDEKWFEGKIIPLLSGQLEVIGKLIRHGSKE